MKVHELRDKLLSFNEDANVYLYAEQAGETVISSSIEVINSFDEAPYDRGDSPFDPKYYTPIYPIVLIRGSK